jgi:hypothetical protein
MLLCNAKVLLFRQKGTKWLPALIPYVVVVHYFSCESPVPSEMGVFEH